MDPPYLIISPLQLIRRVLSADSQVRADVTYFTYRILTWLVPTLRISTSKIDPRQISICTHF